MTPTFSVLVPVYNHWRYVGAALESLLAQTDGDWEAVVVDDGSTDGTPGVVAAYAGRDARIRSFRKENGGVASALNRGLAEARGQWICWLSSDDLFESTKLALHREWFARAPDCRFFFTHFRCLDDATGERFETDLWQPLPEREMQVIRLLRGNYISGISICARRDAIARAGPFNEKLRVSQDYDMWLRLAAIAPAVFLPERTCVSRVHRGQDSKTQRQRCAFEAGEACIDFLNTHTFEDLFPLLDLGDAAQADRALVAACDVAANPHAFVYGLGAHHGLLLRIARWVWQDRGDAQAKRRRDYFFARARTAAQSQRGNDLGHLWRTAAAACRASPGGEVDYDAVSTDVVRHRREAALDGRARGGQGGGGLRDREILMVAHPHTRVDAGTRYGASWMTFVMARVAHERGARVVLAGCSPRAMGVIGGVPFLGAATDDELHRVVAAWGATDILVGVSRTDVVRWTPARHIVFYHHSLGFMPGGLTPRQVRRLGATVVVPSEASRSLLVGLGLRPDDIRVVRNTYDVGMFHPGEPCEREPHRLVHVCNPSYGKGTDIALKALAHLRADYPDAALDVFGTSLPSWEQSERALLREGWVDARGLLDWNRIEADLPGVKYHGMKDSARIAAAFRRASLLVLPSRMENAPIAALEAQAVGCIPVMPRVGGVAEVVDDGRTGILYEPNTPEELAGKIAGLWVRDRPSDDDRAWAARWVRERFDIGSAADEFAACVLAARRSSHALSLRLHARSLTAYARRRVADRWRCGMARS